MKRTLTTLLLATTFTAGAQQHSLEKIWETDTIVAVPESVLPDMKSKLLFISLIDGGGWIADGKGGVGKLSLDGKQLDSTWIKGLDAPKGMGRVDNRLYAADISKVVVINIKNGTIEKKISIEGASGLNDITVNDKGVVYVSDSRTGKIWRIEKDNPTLYLDSLKGVNGLKAIKNELYIGAGKSFIKAGADKKITTIAEMPQSIDGIEPVGNGDFIVTSWGGYVYYVSADGKTETLLETYTQNKNTADIGYDQQKRILYVPTFNGKTVIAYKLK
jgi:hypothetical protein